MRKLDITDKKYNQLIAIKELDKRSDGKVVWLFLCSCGKKYECAASLVKNNKVKSCGHIKKTQLGKHSITHGATIGRHKTQEFQTWLNVKKRCKHYEEHTKRYYGDITMCDRWNDYVNFLEDMGKKPSPKHSIDRINPYGNYEPSNCRWATQLQQARNKRANYHRDTNIS